MQVKLKVVDGSNAGREVPVPVTQFLIGRGEECHLRPKSDAVSRRHCAIVIKDNRVYLRDFQSKNGTLINGERVDNVQELKAGDRLEIGPLNFELVIDYPIGGAKRPLAKDVKEVATRTAETSADDLDISGWLENGDDTSVARQVADPDTRQFRLDETDRVAMESTTEEEGPDAIQPDVEEQKARWKKPEPGKLPPRPKQSSADSREAAADMLKRFFNRR